MPSCPHQVHLAFGGDVEAAAARRDGREHRRMRQRLHGIVQPKAAEVMAEQAVLCGDPLGVEHQQRGAVPIDERCPALVVRLCAKDLTELGPS